MSESEENEPEWLTLEDIANLPISKSAIKKKRERVRNRILKYNYAKLFNFMRKNEDSIGKEKIDAFVKSHTKIQKEVITFVVKKY